MTKPTLSSKSTDSKSGSFGIMVSKLRRDNEPGGLKSLAWLSKGFLTSGATAALRECAADSMRCKQHGGG